MKNILLTGATGYIASHSIIELLNRGYSIIGLDNLSNSSLVSLDRVQDITDKTIRFYGIDIRDKKSLKTIFENNEIDSVIHFAGLKAVGESVDKPLKYYDNNVCGSVTLLEIMDEFNCKNLVFSSSATVYGDPASVPINESFPLETTNPYGASKLMVENILQGLCKSDQAWSVTILRYFNPVGAHSSGLIGEDPNGVPNNLMPYISQVAAGKRKRLNVFGGDYETPDGTGVRDYIHVVDLAKGHLKALESLQKQTGLLTVNLGTGRGYSVLEMVKAFEKASGKAISYEIAGRRSGDVAQCYADPNYALEILGWEAEYDIDRMCQDAWRWQSMNPNGYSE